LAQARSLNNNNLNRTNMKSSASSTKHKVLPNKQLKYLAKDKKDKEKLKHKSTTKDKDKEKDKNKDKEKATKEKEKEKHDKDKEKDKDNKIPKEPKDKDSKDVKDKEKKQKKKGDKKDKGKETKGLKLKKAGSDMKKKLKGGGRTRSSKAGLFFPVGRIHRLLKERVPRHTRVGATAAIYLAAVMEYVVAEVLESAGNQAKMNRKRRISPRNIQLAIKKDHELSVLIKATISGGGVVPNIHAVLQRKRPAPMVEDRLY